MDTPSPDASAQRPRAIVAGHGDFAQGMVSAVQAITGLGMRLVPFSSIGLAADQIEAALRQIVEEHGVGVIFSDLAAGSATLAARRLSRALPQVTVVTGTNLPTLLDFVFQPEHLSPHDAAQLACEKGRASLLVQVTPS